MPMCCTVWWHTLLSFVHRPLPIHKKFRVHRVHRINTVRYIYFTPRPLEMIASLRISSVIGDLGDVDRGTWVKACLGVGTTALVLRLVKAHLEKKAYWARWPVIFIYITSDICMVYKINTSVICIVNIVIFNDQSLLVRRHGKSLLRKHQ